MYYYALACPRGLTHTKQKNHLPENTTNESKMANKPHHKILKWIVVFVCGLFVKQSMFCLMSTGSRNQICVPQSNLSPIVLMAGILEGHCGPRCHLRTPNDNVALPMSSSHTARWQWLNTTNTEPQQLSISMNGCQGNDLHRAKILIKSPTQIERRLSFSTVGIFTVGN